MATAPLHPKTSSCHARSTSFPSTSNPLTLGVEEQLYSLRSSDEATSSLSSPLHLCHKLSGLKDLYDCLDDLLQLPHTQQALSHTRLEECVNQELDASLRVLDACSTSRDVLLEMKENVLLLLSSLRRKRVGEVSLANDIGEHMTGKKKLNKAIQNCLGDPEKMVISKRAPLPEDDVSLVPIFAILREVKEITVSIFKALLLSVSQPSRRKPSGWTLVSKLMHTRKVAEEAEISETEKVDVALSRKGNEILKVQNVVKQFEALDLSIHGLEEGL